MDLLEKHLVMVYWMRQRLSACEQSVLQELVFRQNSKTGQCNPSVETIANDIKYSERAVRAALTKLVNVGAIHRRQLRRNQSNFFAINRVKDCDLLEACRWQGTDDHQNRKNTAPHPEEDCSSDLKAPAPKHKKEKGKKSESTATPVSLKAFMFSVEKTAVEAGIDLEDLARVVPVDALRLAHRSYCEGKCFLWQARQEILEQYELKRSGGGS